MLQTLRRSSRLAFALVLALAAGPAVSALCAHGAPLAGDHEMGEAKHAAMADMGTAPEAPPCHERPAPEPEPNTDCLSACCASGAPVVPPLALDAPPNVPLATVAEAPLASAATPLAMPEPHPPPEVGLRLHLLLGRFLN